MYGARQLLCTAAVQSARSTGEAAGKRGQASAPLSPYAPPSQADSLPACPPAGRDMASIAQLGAHWVPARSTRDACQGAHQAGRPAECALNCGPARGREGRPHRAPCPGRTVWRQVGGQLACQRLEHIPQLPVPRRLHRLCLLGVPHRAAVRAPAHGFAHGFAHGAQRSGGGLSIPHRAAVLAPAHRAQRSGGGLSTAGLCAAKVLAPWRAHARARGSMPARAPPLPKPQGFSSASLPACLPAYLPASAQRMTQQPAHL